MISDRILGLEKISKLFVKFAVPGVFGMLAMGIYTIINGIFLGRYSGSEALASVNLVYPLLSVLSGICIVVSVGTQSVVGIKLGEKKYSEAQDCFKSSFFLIISVSIIALIFLILFSKGIGRLLGATDELINTVVVYIKYCALAMPFFETMFFFDYATRLIGKPLYATVTTMITIVINIVLEYLLVAQYGMGVTGVGIAVGISYIIGFVIFLFPMLNRKNTINLFAGKFNKAYLPMVIKNGFPEGVSAFATAVTTFTLNFLFLKYSGNNGVAAFSVVGYIAYVGILIFWGVCDGVRPIISFNFGEKKSSRILALLKISLTSIFIIDLIVFLSLYFKGAWFITFFINENDPLVINLAINGIQIYALAFLTNGINSLITGYYTSIGNAKIATILSLFKGIVFVGVGICILPILFGITGVWLIVPVAEALTLLLSVVLIVNSLKVHTQDAL